MSDDPVRLGMQLASAVGEIAGQRDEARADRDRWKAESAKWLDNAHDLARKLEAAEARVRELEAERDAWQARNAANKVRAEKAEATVARLTAGPWTKADEIAWLNGGGHVKERFFAVIASRLAPPEVDKAEHSWLDNTCVDCGVMGTEMGSRWCSKAPSKTVLLQRENAALRARLAQETQRADESFREAQRQLKDATTLALQLAEVERERDAYKSTYDNLKRAALEAGAGKVWDKIAHVCPTVTTADAIVEACAEAAWDGVGRYGQHQPHVSDHVRALKGAFALAPTVTADRPLARLRDEGWVVAVHNDYRLAGKPMTFWLLTHADGRYTKGEGATDIEALDAAWAARPQPTVPSVPSGDTGKGGAR